MRVTERAVLGSLTGVVVVVALGLALADGNLAGFQYPGSEAVFAVAFTVCGAVVLGAHPGHAVGRLLMWAGFVGALGQLGGQLDLEGVSGVLFASWGLMLVAIARFPDGDWVSRWAKWFTWSMLGAFTFQLVLWMLVPAYATSVFGQGAALAWTRRAGEANPLFFVGISAAGVLGIGFTLSAVLGMWRVARGDPVRTRQIWVVILGGVLALLVGLPARPLEELGSPLAGVLNALSALIFPVTVMVAIMRYRLYEIDRVVSRTVSYAIVLGAMTGVAFAAGAGLTLMLGEVSDLVVAISTLAGVSVSVPVARRVRGWVDRRFFRSRYDAAEVVGRVADELRTTVDLDQVEARAESVIDEVFSPEAVGVWLAGRSAIPGS